MTTHRTMHFLTRHSLTRLSLLAMAVLVVAHAGCEGDDSQNTSSGSGAATQGGGDGVGGASSSVGGGQAGGGGAGGGVGGGPANGACAYPGIPHPTDALPAGIMPTLPTPGGQPGFPYDPCTIEAPEISDAATPYVVSIDGDDATAGNGGLGTEAAPRRSIPEGSFGPGTVIYVHGNNSPYGTVDFDMGDETDWTFSCTAAEPCFVVGIDNPRMGRRLNIANSSHLIIDGVSVVDIPGGGRPWGNLRFSDSQFITLRHAEVRGDGSNSSGGSVISMSNVEHMVTFDTQIHSAGSWESNATDVDVHGWRPAYGNRYLWLLDSELYHLQADGVQTGNSNNQNPQSQSSHYIYIGGNTFYENYENALDNKNSYHVVFSTNDVHDHYAAPDASGANSTAVILSNNSEGPWTGYHWAINNRIWNAGLAIRDSGSEADERNFIIGNAVWNVDGAFVQANNDANRELWIIHNSVSGSQTAFDVFQPGTNASLFIRGNVFHAAGTIDTMSDVNSVFSGNVLFDTTLQGNWDEETGTITADPLLADPAAGDMTPSASSPALDAASEDAVFALFTSLYGLDIRTDLHGTPRPAGAWDIGAVELP